MTNEQLRNLAVAALKQSTVSYPTWAANKKAGRYPHPDLTAWGKAFAYLEQIGVAAAPPPPPPGVRRSPWTSPPWAGKGVHFAWGLANGMFTPQQAAQKCKDAGCRWAALEGFPQVAGSSLDNTPFHAPFKAELHKVGLKYLVWERTDQMTFAQVKQMIDTVQPDGYLADIEVDWGRPENETLPAQLAAAYPNLPRAVLIAGMPDAQYLQSWIKAGFDCMTQAYSGPGGFDPGVGIAMSMDSDAFWRGWPTNAQAPKAGWAGHDDGPHSWPVLEVNSDNSASLRAQLPAVKQFGGNFSVYCGEIMSADDWNVLGSA